MKLFAKIPLPIVIILLLTLTQQTLQNNNHNSNSQANSHSSQEDDSGIQICGGFIEIDNHPQKKDIDLSNVIIRTYTIDMIMKEQTTVAQSGYYFLPVYERESLIMKITGPYGMVFEPEQYVFNVNDDIRIEDYCREDNNFKFRGYIVKGQISTFGTVEGPKGVAITLFSKDSTNSSKDGKDSNKSGKDGKDSNKHQKLEYIQATETSEKGIFEFSPLYPGTYLLKPTREIDISKFDTNHRELEFTLKPNQETFLEKALIIKGYEVSGSIVSDNNPAQSVLAVIYSFNSTLVSSYECQFPDDNIKSLLSGLEYEGMKPFCLSRTNKQGRFVLSNIPYGSFLVRPYYKSKNVSYDIEPSTVKVDVEHNSYEIVEKINVVSFSITGRVVNHKGKGIAGVSIKVDGMNKAITTTDGYYTLKSLVSGNYDLEAHTDDMYFDPIQNLRITATTDSLPDFLVKDYKLCGKIHIEANDGISSAKRSVLLKEKETNVERRTITDLQGRFCFEVKPSVYFVQPILSMDEKNAELHLTPEYLDVEIVDAPSLDVNFYQSKVEVSGVITCLQACQADMKVFLTSIKKAERVVSVSIERGNSDREYSFRFDSILSGQYKLNIQKYEWCWDKEEVIIKVQNTVINDLSFKQAGYSLFFATQYDIKADFEYVKDSTTKGSTIFKKNESKICLPLQGEYRVYPKSCHKFEKEYYNYNTEKKERLQLVPSEFLVNGYIVLSQTVQEDLGQEGLHSLGMNVSVEELKANSLDLYKKISNLKTTEKQVPFSFYTKSKTNLLVTPEVVATAGLPESIKSKVPKLLFFPKFKQIRVEESCSENAEHLKFEMRVGLIIEGSVVPAMDGVRIHAYSKANGEVIASSDSSADGKYKIGPLFTDITYDIKAVKDGYKITPTAENSNIFKAEKLSFLRVKIVDNSGKSLSGVILSLSSSDKSFKINASTNTDGYYDFVELYSGDYSIKPLLKEYKFEPSERVVKVVGGEHYTETIHAHRVAFSIFGKINNLSREKVEGITVQAYNTKTKQLQDTSIDKNMEYRLRGLTPDQEYHIKVKIPFSSNIEKALPASIPITLGQADVTGVDFLVLTKPKTVDIRGYLSFTDEEDQCPEDRVKNIVVEVRKLNGNEIDSDALDSRKLLLSCQFIYTRMEKAKYQVKLIEKQGKAMTKVLSEQVIDLSDDKDVNDGVRVHHVKIQKAKSSMQENINNTLFSPLIIALMVIGFFQWDSTMWLLRKIISLAK